MPVELRELRYFVALAEELNFTRAAARVHLAQQGLSTAIRQMEQRLGAALFTRSTRSVTLTATGSALLPYARRALATVDAGLDAVAAVKRGAVGHLRVGFGATGALDLTPRLLRAYAQRYPDVSLSVRQFGFEDPSGGLRAGASDVAVVRPPFADAGLRCEQVMSEPRWAVLASGHPHAAAESLRFEQIADERWIDADTDTDWCSFWSCDEMRTRPVRRGPTCQSYDELFEAVRAEQAIAVVPESLVTTYAWPGLAFVRVSDIAPSTVAIAWPSDGLTAAGSRFVELVDELTSSLPPHPTSD